jgi:hypothetical protein
MPKSCVRKTFGNGNTWLQLDEFAETRLLLAIFKIAPSRTQKADVGTSAFFAASISSNVISNLSLWAGRMRQIVSQAVSFLSRLVGKDFGAEDGEFLAFRRGWVKRETGHRINLFWEVGICQNKFGDQVASLTIHRRDADVPRRHGDSTSVVEWFFEKWVSSRNLCSWAAETDQSQFRIQWWVE